jgi:hypothetical protein
MILRFKIKPFLILALIMASVAAIIAGISFWAYADSQTKKILVLPFYVAPGENEKELRDFGDHVNKRIRSVIDLVKEGYVGVPQKITDETLDGKPASENDQEARSVAAKINADLVVYGFLSYEDSQFHMRGVMWDLVTDREIVSTDMKVGNIHGLPGILQLFVASISKRLHGAPALPLYRAEPSGPGGSGVGQPDRLQNLVSLPRSAGPWRSPEISAELWAVGIGDLEGDKRNEAVFLEETGLTISRFEAGSLKTLSQFTQAPVRYISLDVEDLDGDGMAEVIACYLTPNGLESAIMTYKNRKFEVTQRFPNIILGTVIEGPGGKKELLGQRTDSEDMFDGEMVRFNFQNGDAVPSGTTSLPPGTLLLSYATGEFGKNKEFLRIVLNQDQRLMVFDAENRLISHVPDRIYGLERRVRIPAKKGFRDIILPGRLCLADTDGDGEQELLLIKQGGGGSSIQALIWDVGHFVEKWKTVTTPGIISDFRIGDLKNEKTQSLVLILLKPSPLLAFAGPRSVVFAYDLNP